MTFCLNKYLRFVANHGGPISAIILLSTAQAVHEYNKSPCFCEDCGRLQPQVAEYVAQGVVLPGQTESSGVQPDGDRAGDQAG